MPLAVFVAFESEKSAEKAAERIVRKRLAACASVLPKMKSAYIWKKKLCRATECLMIAKTTEKRYPALEREARRLHSYEVPEIIAIRIARGSRAYLAWLEASCSKNLKTSSRLKKQALFKGR
ncbi:MAG: divalent-cation tolerance protein CutA [Candidatus ainarchaeum sp.]|nr:divalent-cation tolerance protein CutA [Candidatus ainarchaeum sp.]